MLICPKCRKKLNNGLKFCTQCGEKMKKAAPGKRLLKVAGILFIIIGIAGIILYIINIIDIVNNYNVDFSLLLSSDMIIFFIPGVIIIIISIFYIFMGFSGVKFCNNTEKAKLLKCFALILIIPSIALLIFSSIITKTFSWISLFILILPMCFLVGAQMNLKAKGEK